MVKNENMTLSEEMFGKSILDLNDDEMKLLGAEALKRVQEDREAQEQRNIERYSQSPIITLREELNLSREEFAKMINMPIETLQRLERKKSRFNGIAVGSLCKLARGFNIKTEILFGILSEYEYYQSIIKQQKSSTQTEAAAWAE